MTAQLDPEKKRLFYIITRCPICKEVAAEYLFLYTGELPDRELTQEDYTQAVTQGTAGRVGYPRCLKCGWTDLQ